MRRTHSRAPEAKYWNQTQVIFWICTRDRSAVRRIADQSQQVRLFGLEAPDDAWPGDIGKVIQEGVCEALGRDADYFLMPFEDAEEEAIDELSSGKLRAWGRKNGKGPRERIPAEEWPGLGFYHFEMAAPVWPERSRRPAHVGRPHDRNGPFWTDVILEREAILKIWSPREETPNGEPEAPGEHEAEQSVRAVADPAKRAKNKRLAGAALGKGYRLELVEAAVEHFDHYGFDNAAQVARWLQDESATREDGGISASTAKYWATEVIKRLRERRED